MLARFTLWSCLYYTTPNFIVNKSHKFDQFCNYQRVHVQTLNRSRPNLVRQSSPMVYAYISNFIWIGIDLYPIKAAKKVKFYRIWTSLFCTQLPTFPYPKVPRSLVYSDLQLSSCVFNSPKRSFMDMVFVAMKFMSIVKRQLLPLPLQNAN